MTFDLVKLNYMVCRKAVKESRQVITMQVGRREAAVTRKQVQNGLWVLANILILD